MELGFAGRFHDVTGFFLTTPMTVFAPTCRLCGARELRTSLSLGKSVIAECRHCGNACTLPAPDKRDYAQESFTKRSLGVADGTDPSELHNLPRNWRKSIRLQVTVLTERIPKGTRVIEIGCAEGLLLKELQTAGFDCLGVEPSTVSSKAARARGLDVICDAFPSPQIVGSFGVAVLSHSLEHFAEPTAVLSQVTRLVPDGYVFLSQTNYKGIVPFLYKQRWAGWAPESHYWHFTPRGVISVVRQLGLVPVACCYNSLVHGDGMAARLLEGLSTLIPPWSDQFHMLLHVTKHN
jgi:SAM-dependent methyltransferase